MEKDRLLSIDELKELFNQEVYQPEDAPEELKFDETFISNYAYIGTYKSSLVLDHLLVEIMMRNQDSIIWANVTNQFTLSSIIEILRIWLHPLTWLPVDRHITNQYIVKGEIAGEMYCNARVNDPSMEEWIKDMLHKRTVYFGSCDLLAEYDMMIDGSKKVLKNMRVWHYITEDVTYMIAAKAAFGVSEDMKIIPFDGDMLISNLAIIAESYGEQRAALLIGELRNDWKYIHQLKLFDIDKCSEEEIARFEYTLFREIEPQYLQWKNTSTAQPQSTYETKRISSNSNPTEEELQEIFKTRYCKTQNCQRLVTYLIDEREDVKDTDWLRMAYEIYSAKDYIKNTPTFKEWLRKFCQVFRHTVAYKSPSDFNRTANTKNVRCYLSFDDRHEIL